MSGTLQQSRVSPEELFSQDLQQSKAASVSLCRHASLAEESA